MKRCNGCKSDLPLSEFYIRRASNDGLSPLCKTCVKAKVKAWVSANPNRAKATAIATYTRNKDAIKAKANAWRIANPERRRAIVAKSDQKRSEKKKRYSKLRNANLWATELEKMREASRRGAAIRRSRELNNGGTITQEWWDTILSIIETKNCLYCGKKTAKFVMDHFIPISRGGRTEVGNLLPCCFGCNASKRNKMPEVWVHQKCGEDGYAEIVWFLNMMREACNSDLPALSSA